VVLNQEGKTSFSLGMGLYGAIFFMKKKKEKAGGSHGNDYEKYQSLGYDAVQSDKLSDVPPKRP
jgi:hypothetical protein